MRSLLIVVLCFLLGCIASSAFGQTEAVIVETFPEGKTVLVVENHGGVVTHRIVTLSVATDPRTPKPTPPDTDNELADWISSRVNKINDPKKDDVRTVLSASYLALAERWRNGEYKDMKELMGERKRIHEAMTIGLESSKTEWDKLDAELIAELNRREIQEDQLGRTLEIIAAGYSTGKAISITLIVTILEILRNLDNETKIVPLILKVLSLLN